MKTVVPDALLLMKRVEGVVPFVKWRETGTWSIAMNGDSKNLRHCNKCRQQKSSGAWQQIRQVKP